MKIPKSNSANMEIMLKLQILFLYKGNLTGSFDFKKPPI